MNERHVVYFKFAITMFRKYSGNMEYSILVPTLLLPLLGYKHMAYGQTNYFVPVCDYINRAQLEKSVALVNGVINEPPARGSELYFTLNWVKDNGSNSYTGKFITIRNVFL